MLSGYICGKLIGAAIPKVSRGPGNDERCMVRSTQGAASSFIPAASSPLFPDFSLASGIHGISLTSTSSPKMLFQSPQWWWHWNFHLPLRPVSVSIFHGVSKHGDDALTPWPQNSSSGITQPHLPQHSLTCGCTVTQAFHTRTSWIQKFPPIHNQSASSSFLLSSLFPVCLLMLPCFPTHIQAILEYVLRYLA